MRRRRLLAAAIALLLAAACNPPDPAPGDEAAAAPEPAAAGARIYEVRGIVRRLPDPQRHGGQILIHHEAIEDFVGIDGETTGMEAMSMSFPLAEGLPVADLSPGDPVAFRLEVDWEADLAARIVAIEKLPADTELDL